jgi:transposase
VLESAILDGAAATNVVRPTSAASACPGSGARSQRIHSRYRRRVADLPIAGRPVRLLIAARRFHCDCAHALVTKAHGTNARKCMTASEGLVFVTAAGPAIMRGRQVDKTMFLAVCKSTEFDVIKTFPNVKSGTACKT